MLENRPILNRRYTQKKIRKNLAIARRKMEQILKDQVNNKLSTAQIKHLSNIMAAGTALNKNLDRENANEQIFLNNLIKEISGKNLLTFKPSADHEGLELPQFNWANKLLPEKTKEQKKHNAMRNKTESIAVLQHIRNETHKQMMARESKLADLVVSSFNA